MVPPTFTGSSSYMSAESQGLRPARPKPTESLRPRHVQEEAGEVGNGKQNGAREPNKFTGPCVPQQCVEHEPDNGPCCGHDRRLLFPLSLLLTTDRGRGCRVRHMPHRQIDAKKRAGPEGPAPNHDRNHCGQVFSCNTVWPRGLRISSMKACISADGALVNWLTT